ncbi:hypothetical protein CDAR_99701, partial [Caerostris darwini]
MISTPRNIPNQCRRFLWILARRVWGQWVLTGCSPSADLTVPQPGRVRQWGWEEILRLRTHLVLRTTAE